VSLSLPVLLSTTHSKLDQSTFLYILLYHFISLLLSQAASVSARYQDIAKTRVDEIHFVQFLLKND